ncbi:Alpha/Beta hydrolase protein [Fusarium flagelliforme]|uniref:Esterase n=1 Tax=Fusarium flagelliforme TaxID=2675880 RepID=A0A395MDS1_9HYPO|nr:Alpha/Beta hydrolase protein [Fusarium flagelliforme]KAH7192890.1 Alpha/Beta hydrolase protein [Fusarium flagelliforme]RFN46072.1 esterase [Fusarium flagelliforme]
MPSWSASFVAFYIKWIRQSKVIFDSPENTRKALQDGYIRPQSFNPPTNLGSDIVIDRVDVNEWPLYKVSQPSSAPRDALLYIHGGAFFREIDAQHWNLVAQIARETNVDVLVPIYPLVPRPGATAEKLAAGFMDICRLSEQTVVSIGGDSAGGMLALATAQQLRDTQPEIFTKLTSLVLISPVVDLALDHPEVVRLSEIDPWLGINGIRDVITPKMAADRPVKDPIVSPLYGSVENLPPTILLSGTTDMLCGDARRLKSKFSGGDVEVASAGSTEMDRLLYVEKEDMIHVYAILPTPEGAEARSLIVHFINKYLDK